MATRILARSLLTIKPSLSSALSHSSVLPNSSSFLFRLRPIVAASSASYFSRLLPAISTRALSTHQTASSLNDPNPNWSNSPPKETILFNGTDFEHWLVFLEEPEGDPSRDEIIDYYIRTLATVIGSEEDARMKIYSVSTRHYYAFGALVSEELSHKLKELPKVCLVLPDSYLDFKNKEYGGEPFINGQAVPYDPKYHEEWVRNKALEDEIEAQNDRELLGPNSGGPDDNYNGGQPNSGGDGVSQNNPGNYQRPPMTHLSLFPLGPGPNNGPNPSDFPAGGPGPNLGGFSGSANAGSRQK